MKTEKKIPKSGGDEDRKRYSKQQSLCATAIEKKKTIIVTSTKKCYSQ